MSVNFFDLHILDIPKKEWVVENLFSKGSSNCIWSGPGTGKSSFSYSLSASIACGISFLGWAVPNPCNVLYLDGEQSKSDIRDLILPLVRNLDTGQIKANEEDIGFKLISYEQYYESTGTFINLFDPRDRGRIDYEINKLNSEFIVIDNLSSLTFQDSEWNKRSKQWEGFVVWMRKHQTQGKTFLLLHHSNKNSDMAGLADIRRPLSVEIELKKIDQNKPDINFNFIFRKARLHPSFAQPKQIYYTDSQGWLTKPYHP